MKHIVVEMLEHTSGRVKVAVINEWLAAVSALVSNALRNEGVLGSDISDHLQLLSRIIEPVTVVLLDLLVDGWVYYCVDRPIHDPDTVAVHVLVVIDCAS